MRTNRVWLAPLGLGLLLLFLSGCAVPLGPGYQLHQETVVVHYRPGTPLVLHVRTETVVRGFGNKRLRAVRVLLPDRFPADGHVSVRLAGRTVPAVPKRNKGKTILVVPLQHPLSLHQSIDFELEYTLHLAAAEFILEPKDWTARFLRPAHLFSHGRPRAEKTELKVVLPSGYRVLMGQHKPAKSHVGPRGETEYRYVVHRRDFEPFLAVGKFTERKVRSDDREVAFWTLQTLDEACAQTMAGHLAAVAELYRSDFGPSFKHRRTIPVIELPPGGQSYVWDMDDGFGSVPGGLVFSIPPAELCKRPKDYFATADRALAATWFGWVVTPEPDARAIFGGGAQRYAAFLAEEGSNGTPARERQVRAWLKDYERLRAQAKPVAPTQLDLHAAAAQRRMAGIQSALCLIALQDRFGPEPVRSALAHLIHSFRGSSAGLDDVRSALEEATGKNLFNFVNRWLRRPGIPGSFRQRYLTARPKAAEEDFVSSSRRAR